jgi:AcrR family transcriptional regulator
MNEKVQRDRTATEARLITAVEDLILQEGFGAIGINAVARRAGTDKVLIYRYFGGLSGLLAAYAEEGDFWWTVEGLLCEPLSGADDEDGLVACLATIFARHCEFLRAHPVTLEVIAWEMSERNELTEALEKVRESRSQEMMRRLAARFGLDEGPFLRRVGPMLALLGAAANYLAARGRRLRIFNGIDLQSDQGWQALQASAAAMIAGALAASPDLPPDDSRRS